jgi:hypothetical protein
MPVFEDLLCGRLSGVGRSLWRARDAAHIILRPSRKLEIETSIAAYEMGRLPLKRPLSARLTWLLVDNALSEAKS